MAYNKNPQSLKNIFSRQSNGAVAETLNASVRQDKDRFSSDLIGTRQPASVKQAKRSHPTNPKSTRSQINPIHKTRAVHLNLWLQPIVKAELQRLAEQEGLSVSATGAALLEAAIRQKLHIQQGVLLQPIIKTAIHETMRGISNRLAFLLARTAFTSEQTRSLATNILGRQPGMTEETLKTILAMTKRSAKGDLTRRNPELEELIAAIKQWVEHAEQEPTN
jgi:hypothetical protein